MGVNLAISLHAVSDNLRDELVPINRKYPLASLIEACRNYPGLSNARRITWEYVMLKNINDSKKDALNLVKLIKGIPSKINLIPFNPWPGSIYETSTEENISNFAKILMEAGFEWREPGCSMCLAMNDDRLEAGQRSASTSNRNFKSRQGFGGRTHLVSPAMAAAAAIMGRLADVREFKS